MKRITLIAIVLSFLLVVAASAQCVYRCDEGVDTADCTRGHTMADCWVQPQCMYEWNGYAWGVHCAYYCDGPHCYQV
jgi:hypothetical protein